MNGCERECLIIKRERQQKQEYQEQSVKYIIIWFWAIIMMDQEDFRIRDKKYIKIQKQSSKKNNLRNNYIPSKKFVQSSQDSEEECFIQKTLQKGSLWWSKTNLRFFRQITPHDFASVKEKSTTSEILTCKYPAIRLKSYFQQKIVAKNPFMNNEALVRVLYRRELKEKSLQHYELVTYGFKLNEEPLEKVDQISLGPRTHIISFKNQGKKCLTFDQSELSHLSLHPYNFQTNKAFIHQLLKLEVKKKEIGNEVDRQIEFWTQQLEINNYQCSKNFDDLNRRMKIKNEPPDIAYDKEILSIKRNLRMAEILLYFKLGHSDKTEQMLDDATQIMLIKEMNMKTQLKKKKLTKIEQMKSLFETDCKICFCTESDDKNRVLYCDSCNTSFHQSCYGVEYYSLQEKFYCQVCKYLEQHLRIHEQKVRKPVCQLCSQSKFPMKSIEGRFYHVTCLILFGLVQIRDYRIGLKKGIDHRNILDLIVENQIESNHCQYCLKDCGMKFKCRVSDCDKHFHPICAYLNGQLFNLSRNFQTLHVQIECYKHNTIDRNHSQQVYFRRFFCDYKGTSNLTEEDFKIAFQKEQAQRKEAYQLKTADLEKLPALRKMKLLKNMLSKNLLKKNSSLRDKSEKQIEASQSIVSIVGQVKKQISNKNGTEQFTSSAQPPQIETETRKLLKKINQTSMKG